MKTKCALFDFDNTLCRGDSIVPFVLYAIRKGKAPWTQLFKAAAAFLMQKRHPEKIAYAKEHSLSFLRGRTVDEMDHFCRGFLRDVLIKRMYPAANAELDRLHAEGYHIVVISASVEAYMHLLPEFLPVDAVLATRCGVDENGLYTGDIGENCKGIQKPLRLAAYLAAKRLELDREQSCAYGDSASDWPMMELTDTPRLVNPSAKVRRLHPHVTCLHWTKTKG